MFYNARKQLKTKRFNLLTRAVRQCANVKLDRSSTFSLVTQLQEADINMYLLALASFCRFLSPKRIIVVSDHISEKGCQVLRSCVPEVSILPIDEVRDERLPKGGCWERLTTIVNHLDDSYVIQLDADTLTLNEPVDVIDCVKKGRSFTLVANPTAKVVSMTELAEVVKGWTQSHVQVKAEQAMGQFENAANRLYVRGCAAFTGFAKNGVRMQQLVDYSREMESHIGAQKWGEWGGEQVASNYLIASMDNAYVLPFEHYPFYKGDQSEEYSSSRLCHFIGSNRFDRDLYLKLSKRLIKSLKNVDLEEI
ncbi:hypothetical protein HBA55_26195 [Pseudomaricurvus alkylphenolicus]|uniref:hypothetical protein n=1 Tax=Pseudomaricurvus alkylphenolicus TaxID=1306991 RepID=UPI00141DD3CA|nr:hypothetical protein [Pseudomaricurvus alkylphenolicus]NIB43126.1 hypothetical protein [Pseudomaricurvus alkylphenolicus]